MKNEKEIKKYLLIVLKYILMFIILISIYIGALLATSLIPSKFLKENVTKSSETLEKDGEKKEINLGYKTENIFTFTDALMINIAYSVDSADPLAGAFLARKNYIPGQTINEHIDSQYNLGASEEYINKQNGDLYQTKELYGLMHGENITDSFEYARYWHGYLVVLRPLLAIMDYSAIRIILLIATIILVALLIYKLYKKINIGTAIIFLIGLLSVNIFVVTKGFNEICVFLIALVFSIILLSKKDINSHIGEIFFVIGSLTSFIDLLTAPLVTIGLPLIIYLLILQKNEIKLKDILINMIKVCILWGLGYAFTWISKWVLTQLIFGRPVISQAIEQTKYRAQLNNTKFNYSNVINKNLKDLSNNIVKIILTLLLIYSIIKMVINKKKKVNFKQNLEEIIPYIITGIMPFVWYFVIREHSYIHSFFTYRIMIISIISLFIIIDKAYQPEENTEQIKGANE